MKPITIDSVLATVIDQIKHPKPHPCFTCDGTNLERFPHGKGEWVCNDCHDWAHLKYERPEESRDEIASRENGVLDSQRERVL